MKRSLIFALTLLLAACTSSVPTAERMATSPDGRVRFMIDINGDGRPQYSVMYDGKTIIKPSALGIQTSECDYRSELSLVAVEHSSHSDVWQPVWGQFAEIEDNYNALTATFNTKDDRELTVEVRLYNDGVGMRYTIAGTGDVDILAEITTFGMAEDYDTHWIAGSYDDDEYAYMHTPLSGITREAMIISGGEARTLPYPAVNTPVTMVAEDGTHIAIHEAALWHYPAMSLRYIAEDNAFEVDLASVGEVKSRVTLPFSTPWRTIIVGDRAGALAESTMVLNLNEPCKLEDTSWIEPMKYVGVWWEMHLKVSTWDMDGGAPHCATTENVKRYIDFAAENGFGGVLVEGWNEGWGRGERFDYDMPYPDFDIKELVAYGKERGVKLIGHHETYANVDNYEAQMSDAYAYYEACGVGSVKTGYVGRIANRLHNSREMVDHYNRTVMEAAEHKLCVDIHEPVHSTGICRTYPNLVSAEGMRGQEWQAWNSGNSIDHNPTLPFTRNLAGAMDFTPGIFDVRYHNTVNRAAANEEYRVAEDYNYKFFVNSTLAHQLALYVVFYSPIQMVADLPENYNEHPAALAFIRNVPVNWATTRVPQASIGDYVVTVRKDKDSERWYVGAITDGEARDIELSLDFLDAEREYEAIIYRDGERAGWDSYPTDYVVERRNVTSADVLNLRMAPGGGFAIELR